MAARSSCRGMAGAHTVCGGGLRWRRHTRSSICVSPVGQPAVLGGCLPVCAALAGCWGPSTDACPVDMPSPRVRLHTSPDCLWSVRLSLATRHMMPARELSDYSTRAHTHLSQAVDNKHLLLAVSHPAAVLRSLAPLIQLCVLCVCVDPCAHVCPSRPVARTFALHVPWHASTMARATNYHSHRYMRQCASHIAPGVHTPIPQQLQRMPPCGVERELLLPVMCTCCRKPRGLSFVHSQPVLESECACIALRSKTCKKLPFVEGQQSVTLYTLALASWVRALV